MCTHYGVSQQEAEVGLRKAKQLYQQRHQEHDQARDAVNKAECDGQAQASKVDKRKRAYDDCRLRVNEAEVSYRQAVNYANIAREEVVRMKVSIVTNFCHTIFTN